MTPPHPFVLQLSLILLGIGMVVGLIGSFMSVTKYLEVETMKKVGLILLSVLLLTGMVLPVMADDDEDVYYLTMCSVLT